MSPLHTPALRGTEDGCAPWELSSPQFPDRDCHSVEELVIWTLTVGSLYNSTPYYLGPSDSITATSVYLPEKQVFNNSVCFFEEIK